jgi:hypothetical protein
MKIIIAGSRTINNIAEVYRAFLNSHFDPDEIVSGGAKGVDKLGERIAKDNSIPCRVFSADWGKYGKKAGYLRNKDMAEYADALVAVWDGESKGTANMIKLMKDMGKPVYVQECKLTT